MSYELNFERYYNAVKISPTTGESGKVTRVTGELVEGYLPGAAIGSICRIILKDGFDNIQAEVVGIDKELVLLMPLGPIKGIQQGSTIVLERTRATVKVGPSLLGRILDGRGVPFDGKGPLVTSGTRFIYTRSVNPLKRPIIKEPLDLGIRAINSMLTVGEGQRIGVLAGSGVGKSVLLGMMAKNTNADVNVIALIGERGREVREFIDEILGPEGLKKSVIVAVTSDDNAVVRMRGAFVATTIAEYFASQGSRVLLTMDSVTRFAMAQREIGLSSGEPPTTKGYTPSVFSTLPKLLERAGKFENGGSVTGLYTVLIEGDDMDDPIGDAVRSIVDGHIQLDRKLANRGHFPAIDVLASASRVMRNVTNPEHFKKAMKLKEYISLYQDVEDLLNLGAYQEGTNPKIDRAIELHEPITEFLRQDISESSDLAFCENRLNELVGGDI